MSTKRVLHLCSTRAAGFYLLVAFGVAAMFGLSIFLKDAFDSNIRQHFGIGRKKIILYYTPFTVVGSNLDWMDEFLGTKSNNCWFSVDAALLDEASALIFHRKKISAKYSAAEFPARRLAHQYWVFHSEESPLYYSLDAQSYDGVFNWSVTYRSTSTFSGVFHSVLPARRFQPSGAFASHFPTGNGGDFQRAFSRKRRFAYFLATNCLSLSNREALLRDIEQAFRKHGLTIDFYGRCYDPLCQPAQFAYYCDYAHVDFSEYVFYLAFENSRCVEYITEKPFRNALEKNVIPVVWGARRSDYEKVLPGGSFVFVEDFATWDLLAVQLKTISGSFDRFQTYFVWQQQQVVVRRNVWLDICNTLIQNSSISILSAQHIQELFHFSQCHKGNFNESWSDF